MDCDPEHAALQPDRRRSCPRRWPPCLALALFRFANEESQCRRLRIGAARPTPTTRWCTRSGWTIATPRIKVDTAYINAQVANEIASQRWSPRPTWTPQDDSAGAQGGGGLRRLQLPARNSSGAPTGGQPGRRHLRATRTAADAATERAPFFKNADTVFLTTGTQEVTQVNPKEFEAARLTIPDLGFPYMPLLFAVIQGGALNGANPLGRIDGHRQLRADLRPAHRQLAALAHDHHAARRRLNSSPACPAADVLTPLSGAHTFGLWLGMQTGHELTASRPRACAFWAIAMASTMSETHHQEAAGRQDLHASIRAHQPQAGR